MKKAVSLFLVLAVIATVVVVAFTYPKKGEEFVISKDNISYGMSSCLYGLSLEDISFAGDGGLSSELVCNNSFEYEADRFWGWDIDTISYSVQNKDGLNKNNPNYLYVMVDEECKIFNKGYTEIYDYKTYSYSAKKANTADMGFKKGEKYEFSAYFKNQNFTGEITVWLKAKGNSQKYKFTLDECTDWTKVIFQLESDVSADGGLMIKATGSGIFLMDFVSLVPVNSHGFYEKEWKYTSIRSDLYNTLGELSPSFIRFKCTVPSNEKGTDSLYDWKNAIGPLDERIQSENCWADVDKNRNYGNSNYLGVYEYLMLCRDLNAIPIPVINAGICKQQDNAYDEKYDEYINGLLAEDEWQSYLDTIAIRPDTPEWEDYIENIFDLIEFANGKTETEWGEVRAKCGSEEPFGVRYIAVGDENYGDVYARNFDAIYKAIKEKYPNITVIVSATRNDEDKNARAVNGAVNAKYADVIIDEHYCMTDSSVHAQTDKYDSYERNGAKVMVGEWSVQSAGYGTVQTKNNIWSAIKGAAYLTGIERNADIVSMISYAPVLAKVNSQCTDVNLIWFDSQGVCLTPDYYTQLLFARNYGTQYIATELDLTEKGVHSSVSFDPNEKVIYVKLVNEQTTDVNLTFDIQGFGDVTYASNQYLSEVFKAACNEFTERLHVAPKEETYEITDNKFNVTLEGLSVNVIRIPYGDEEETELYVLPETEIVTPFIHPTFKIAIPFIISLLLVVTALVVSVNSYSLKKKEKAENGESPAPPEE